MRIDSHQHYWSLARGDYGWLTPALAPIHRDFGPDDLAPLLEQAGIDRTILVQAAPTEAETRFMLEIARKTVHVAGVVGWVDCDAEDAPARIAAMARDALLVGLRPMIHDIPDPDWMLSARVGHALGAIEAEGLVFDALVRPRHLARLLVLADRHPALPIVIDHAAKPFIRDGLLDPWRADMAALAARPNVMVKLSGLATEAAPGWQAADLLPYVTHLLATFGPARILWGSDWPVLNLAGDYLGWAQAARSLLAALGADEREAIFGGNAARIYLAKRGKPCA